MSETKTTTTRSNDFFTGGLMAHILTQQSSGKTISASPLVKENSTTNSPNPSATTIKPVIFRRAITAAFPNSGQQSSNTNTSTSASVTMQSKAATSGTTSYTVIATGAGAPVQGQTTPGPQMPLYQLHGATSDHQNQQPGSQQTQQVAAPYQHAAAAFDYGTPHAVYTQPSYYQPHQNTSGGTAASNQQSNAAPGQVLYSSGAYILQTTTNVDGDSHTLAHTTRASPATVQWLLDNYETADGVSLPRSTIYAHYMRHCEEEKLEPMNPASFGKLIRSVFLGLRTRRLGTRGNSKYHYYGIRIKASSPLVNITEDMIMATAGRQYSSPPQQKKFGSRANVPGGRYDGNSGQQTGTTTITVIGTPAPIPPNVAHQVGQVQPGNTGGPSLDSGVTNSNQAATSTVSPQQQFLGDVTLALPRFDAIDLTGLRLPPEITDQDIRIFETLYRDHCANLVDLVVNLQFTLIDQMWSTFWRGADSTHIPTRNDDDEEVDEEVDEDEEGDEEPRRQSKPGVGDQSDARLSRLKLSQLVSLPVVQVYMRRVDSALYQSLVYTLLPDMLRPIPSSLTQSIRNFAKGMESWLKSAMLGLPEEAVRSKLGPAVAFAQTLRRYTSLNHLAQAARAVLQNQEHLQQMVTDLNRVDFVNVQEQAAWVTSCETKVVKQIETDLKRLLSMENSLDNWAAWLESVVDTALDTAMATLNQEQPAQALAEASRSFLLKWSFYNSMVIRDLTLRSAQSFGSFHLIRLLFDEYIYFVLEHRVANAVGEVPIAVLDASRGGTDVPLAEPLHTLNIMQARPDLRGPRLYPIVSASLQAAATAQQLVQTAASAPFHVASKPATNIIITSASTASANLATGFAGTRPSVASKPSVISLASASSPVASAPIKASGIPSRTFVPSSASVAATTTATAASGGKIFVVPVNNNNNSSGNNSAGKTAISDSGVDSGGQAPPIKRLKDDVSSTPAIVN